MKLNFGCGTNLLKGWNNYDSEVDITKRLPFESGVASYIFAEHVVEHVTYDEALEFLKECHRVLRDDGVIRIAVPSIERIMLHGTDDYFKFVSKWTRECRVGRREAMDAILHAHGHRAPWTDDLLRATLYLAGFNLFESFTPGHSRHEALRDVEGHGRVIGEYFNYIETAIVEGTK